MPEKTHWILTAPDRPWQQKGEPGPPTDDPAALASGGCFNELGWTALGNLRAADRRQRPRGEWVWP